jgi:alpha-L-arabinofuranosidase
MKKILTPALFSLFFLLSCTPKPQTEGQISIDFSQKGADVSPNMYGVFFEEINHAGEGGIQQDIP